jgi:hypothetical protein
LPETGDLADIDLSTVKLGDVPAVTDEQYGFTPDPPVETRDGEAMAMVKFPREEIINAFDLGTHEVPVTGLAGDHTFLGTTELELIEPEDENGKGDTRQDSLLWLEDRTAGASDSTMHVDFTIEENSDTIGNSLNSVEITMQDSSLSLFSGTSWKNVGTAGVDKTGDGEIDRKLPTGEDDWIVKDSGSRLKIEFSGSAYTNVKAGHTIHIAFDGVTTPADEGTYAGTVQTSGDGNYQHDTIQIETESNNGNGNNGGNGNGGTGNGNNGNNGRNNSNGSGN